ncbi:hypothetical protein Hanom_Chr06g00533861 [Helianthus anomalus]
MTLSSLRFGQFCDFRPKVCFSAFRFERFENLAIFIQVVNSIQFSPLSQGYFLFFVKLNGNSPFFTLCTSI